MKFLKRRHKRKAIETEDVDITSLLDILVILLVFLLQTFSSSELTVNLADELSLPYSWARNYGRNGVIVQVNSVRKVWVNEKELGELNKEGETDDLLYSELELLAKEERAKLNLKKKVSDDVPLFINLVFDKALKYEDIQKVMQTAAMAGFGKYKFIIQGTE
jgi:biopolymer transport protein ExbD